MLDSRIEIKNGLPTLFVGGEPMTAMAYTTYFEERSCSRDFAAAGYRIFFVNVSFTDLPINSVGTGFTPFRVGVFEDPDEPNYSEFEGAVYQILDNCPDAVIFPRIYVSMPRWWVDAHPNDTIPTPKGGRREALFSEAFRRDGSELLARLVRHIMAADYSDRIGGWQICGGQTQEWFHHDLCGSLGGAAELPYLAWAKKNGIKDAVLPEKDAFIYRGEAYNTDENARRYALFCNLGVAESVDIFAEVIKRETGHRQIVGAFYGYSFENCGTVLFGSHALRRLINSPNIDFLSSPNAYTGNRAFGIDWEDMIPVDSLKLHGKLAFIECDIRTHLTVAVQLARQGEYPDDIYMTNGVSVWAGPPTAELSREGLRKSFAHQLTRGSAIWWFDMWGGWYDDPLLMDELKHMKDIYEAPVTQNYPTAEVVFFADERGYANLFSGSPELSGIAATRTAMGNTGVPYDNFMAEDAEAVLDGYRASVFPMPIASEAGRRAMELCRKMGIPYISASAEHPALALGDLCDFYKRVGVHFYSHDRDVIYLGNGYLGLHTVASGKREIRLPRPLRIKAVFGIDREEQVTDTVTVEADGVTTVLLSVCEPE